QYLISEGLTLYFLEIAYSVSPLATLWVAGFIGAGAAAGFLSETDSVLGAGAVTGSFKITFGCTGSVKTTASEEFSAVSLLSTGSANTTFCSFLAAVFPG